MFLLYCTWFILVSECIFIVAGETQIVFAKEGREFRLKCLLSTTDSTNTKWYKYTNRPTRDKPRNVPGDYSRLPSDGNDLVIDHATEADTGWYSCQTTTGGVPAAQDLYLTVQRPPEVYLHAKRVQQSLGEEVVLECFIFFAGDVEMNWSCNGEKLVNTDRLDIRHINDNMLNIFTIGITSLVPEDFGVYTCSAVTDLGSSADTVELAEYKEDQESSYNNGTSKVGLVVQHFAKVIEQRLGRNVTMDCVIPIDEYPIHSWSFNGTEIAHSKGGQMDRSGSDKHEMGEYSDFQKKRDTFTLTITDLVPEDFGTYSCMADGESGDLIGYVYLKEYKDEVTQDSSNGVQTSSRGNPVLFNVVMYFILLKYTFCNN